MNREDLHIIGSTILILAGCFVVVMLVIIAGTNWYIRKLTRNRKPEDEEP